MRIAPEIGFALMSMSFLGVSDFLYKLGQRWPLRGGAFMLLQNTAFVPTALAVAVARDEFAWNWGLVFGLANGALSFTAFLCLLRALRHGAVLGLVPIVRLNFAVTALLAVVLLGETLTPSKTAALVLAALAIMAGASLRATRLQRRALQLAVIAMFSFGVIGLFYKLGLRAGAEPAAMVLAQSLGVLCLALPYAVREGAPLPRGGVRLWLPLACGALTASSYVALAIAFSHGEAVVVAPIAQLSFVLTGVLAVALLGERLTLRTSAAVAAAVAAVLLFARAG